MRGKGGKTSKLARQRSVLIDNGALVRATGAWESPLRYGADGRRCSRRCLIDRANRFGRRHQKGFDSHLSASITAWIYCFHYVSLDPTRKH